MMDSDAHSAASATHCCDECGKSVLKIWRVRFGHRYCSTCYARVFKRLQCPRCGNFARIPRNIPNAVCRLCDQDEPCHRCGKTDYAVGKLTPYGPVCLSCAPYYRPKRPCALCGDHSPRCVSMEKNGTTVLVCPRCAPTENRTCQACHRYRRLIQTDDGRWLCTPCAERGLIDCPQCH